MRDTISMVCEITPKNYYNWKNKSHKILISLLEKYFAEEELKEFLKSGKILRFENMKKYGTLLDQLKEKLEELDFFQSNALFTMLEDYEKHKLQSNSKGDVEDFKFHYTLVGLETIVKKTNYFPSEEIKSSLLKFYKDAEQEFDIEKVKGQRVWQLFQTVIHLDDYLIYILLNNYKTLINKNTDKVAIPTKSF